jgi:hypothetical protein
MNTLEQMHVKLKIREHAIGRWLRLGHATQCKPNGEVDYDRLARRAVQVVTQNNGKPYDLILSKIMTEFDIESCMISSIIIQLAKSCELTKLEEV